MHPHGVFYEKSSEGAKYLDNTSGDDKKDDGVPTGKTHTYKWLVREEDSPKEGDEPCIAWPYHSHETPTSDINTGLVGRYNMSIFVLVSRNRQSRIFKFIIT